MDKISIPKNKMNIFSLLLLVIVVLFSILYQYQRFNILLLQSSPILIISPIALYLIHEALHYAGFLLIAKLKIEQLILRPIKSNMIPYISTTIPMKPTIYAYVLLLPTIILTGIIFLPVILTPNLIYSVLLGIAVGMGAADLLLAIELFKLDKLSKVVPVGEEWGVLIISAKSENSINR